MKDIDYPTYYNTSVPKPDFTPRNTPAEPGATAHVRDPHPVFFAMLATHKPPDGRVMFVTAETTSAARKLSFSPLVAWDAEQYVFGLVEFQKRYLNQVGWTTDVWRGRRGKKPPEQLTVLHKMPAAMPNWPKPQYNGFMKAVTRAFEGLESAIPAQGKRAWVAIEFAQNGMVRRGVLSPVGADNTPLELGGSAVVRQTENYWVWTEHIKRCATQLAERLSHPKKSNPLLTQLDLHLAMGWLGIKRAEVGLAVLEAFAAGLDREVLPTPEPHVGLAESGLPKREVTEEEKQVAQKILAKFADGEGTHREALGKAFPAHQHIINWLFDARKLQTSPGGFVFTSEELATYSQVLDLGFGEPAPGVRDIKDKLELPRKKAEQLRMLLVTQESKTRAAKREGN